MTYTIYGVREIGGTEVRYVGLTYKPIERRLREHMSGCCVPNFGPWVRANLSRIEVFAIASVEDDHARAKATEKVIIAL